MSDASLSDLSALAGINDREEKAKLEKRVRFEDEVQMNEISRLRRSMLEDMFYASEDLANFRYEAFMEEMGLETEVPVLSVSLTPHTFQETEFHISAFKEHFVQKGREAAMAAFRARLR